MREEWNLLNLSGHPSPETNSLNNELLARLHVALDKLAPETRELLELRFSSSLTWDKIDEQKGISESHARKQINEGLNQLRHLVAPGFKLPVPRESNRVAKCGQPNMHCRCGHLWTPETTKRTWNGARQCKVRCNLTRRRRYREYADLKAAGVVAPTQSGQMKTLG